MNENSRGIDRESVDNPNEEDKEMYEYFYDFFNFRDLKKKHEKEQERSPSLNLETNNEEYGVIYFKAKKVSIMVR